MAQGPVVGGKTDPRRKLIESSYNSSWS